MQRTTALLLSLLGATLVGCAPGSSPLAPVLEDTEAYLDQQVLVAVQDADGRTFTELEDDFGLEVLSDYAELGVRRYALPADLDVPSAVELLRGDERVRYVEPNYLVKIASSNDPYRPYQWNFDAIRVDDAWTYGRGSGVVVAVLDTGVSSGPDGISHLLSGYDFYNRDSDPSDGNGHGTFVAGTIAQNTDNGVGVAGIAPDVKILPVKVMSDQGYGDMGAIVDGITWAVDQGADVINMSLGSAYSSSTLRDACQYAHDHGVVVVVASGNEYASHVDYPAAYDSTIAVGAARYDGSRAGYSNYGSGLDLLAPGGDLSKDQNRDGYADGILQETFERGRWTYTFWEGTSMATPHVAAAAALVVAQGVHDPDEVRSILDSTARDVGSQGYDTVTGYGLLDVAAAVAYAAGGGSGDTGSGDTAGGDTGSGDTGSAGDGSGGSSADTTPPAISNPSAYVDGDRFTIQWVTDEPATSYVTFDGYGRYGDDGLTTSHSLSFRGSRGATYTLTLESTDAAGNTATDGPYQLNL